MTFCGRFQENNEPTSHRKTLRKPAQRTIATPVVMSGPGPARPAGRFLSRAGFRSCVAGATLALLGNHRAHAGAGLVAGAAPRQLARTRVEEPRHIYSDRIDRVGSNVVESAVRQCAG